MNIETSAALAAWIELMHTDFSQFRKMVKAAIELLPSIITAPDPDTDYNQFRAMSAFNSANGRKYLMENFPIQYGESWFTLKMKPIRSNPLRALANGIINSHWRNSELENIHAGCGDESLPLLQRRITLHQEQVLLQHTTAKFVPTMRALKRLVTKPSEETLSDLVLPHAFMFNPPDFWSLDEQSRQVKLWDKEPSILPFS
jgi:hypothetical protein